MDTLERKIVEVIISNGLEEGWTFTEVDVEDGMFINSTNLQEILESCDAVEEIQIVAKDTKEKQKYWIHLVFGNHEDVIANCTTNFDPYFYKWVQPILNTWGKIL